MTLKEIRGESQRVYQDDERLSQTKWVKILGIHSTTFGVAARISGVDVLKGPRNTVTTPVHDFPKIVSEFGRKYTRKGGYEPWAKGVNTKQDFQVIPPSGSLLIYEYPRLRDKLINFVRSIRR